MEFITEIFAAFEGILAMLKGGEISSILDMVKNILTSVKEFEAAEIINIISGFFAA